MTIPAGKIFARARMRRTRRWITAAGAVCAAAGLIVGLLLPSETQARSVHTHLAAWSVNTNSNGTVTLTVRQLSHARQLQHALAEAGVPAIVTFGEQCLNTQNQNALHKAGVTFKVSDHPLARSSPHRRFQPGLSSSSVSTWPSLTAVQAAQLAAWGSDGAWLKPGNRCTAPAGAGKSTLPRHAAEARTACHP